MVGCTEVIHNEPVNRPLAADVKQAEVELGRNVATNYHDTVIALSFSGGGTRAAAFSYGVLTGFDDTHVRTSAGTISLLDHIDFVSGVSGGSVLAAYYGIKKRQAMVDFKQRFLLRNAEESLQTQLSLSSIARGLQGGINDTTDFPRWLDANLFDGATFESLLTGPRPRIWINASDIYNRTPFVFGQTTFGALCSDLASYPVSLAVAASAAVPVLFAPVVVENFPGGCPMPLPAWVQRVRNNENAPPLLKSYADALERYHDGTVRYVKLLDGGLVDNYGLAGLTLGRLASDTAFGPLAPEEAVKLRRLLVLVVDAGRAPSGAWAQTVAGPAGVELITAASDTATESGAVGSYSAFQDTMGEWQETLIDWRCRLSPPDRIRFGAPPGWNCKDVKFFIGRIAFEQLGPERAAALDAVETRFRLPPDQVDMLITAGRDALNSSTVFRSFLNSLPHASPRSTPVAAPVSAAHEAQAE
ncbi:MAG: patatin-like phospholipase family protein [Xanthobacteraceae bacterium]